MPETYVTEQGVRRSITDFPVGLNGVKTPLEKLIAADQGVNRVIWEKTAPFEKVLFLMSEIPTTPTRFDFPSAGKYRVTVIGNGGSGGEGGKKWGLYDGGGGGGGGSGGVFVMDADFSGGVTAYLEFARDYYYVPTANSIYCRFVNLDGTSQHPVFVTSSGGTGQQGQNAGFSTPVPDGGAGGAPGKTDYKPSLDSDDAWQFVTTTYGGWGVEGGRGYHDVDPNERNGEGNGATPPVDGYVYNGLSVGAPVWDGVTLHQNPYQRGDGWSIASWYGSHHNACYGYTVDNICLGNAGAGGYLTINYGDISPGTGAQGGIVIEALD